MEVPLTEAAALLQVSTPICDEGDDMPPSTDADGPFGRFEVHARPTQVWRAQYHCEDLERWREDNLNGDTKEG